MVTNRKSAVIIVRGGGEGQLVRVRIFVIIVLSEYSPRGIFSYTMPSARDAVEAAANATQYRTKHRVIRGPAILPVRTTRTNWRDVVGGPREWYGTAAAATATDTAAVGEKGTFARNSPGSRHMSADYPSAVGGRGMILCAATPPRLPAYKTRTGRRRCIRRA